MKNTKPRSTKEIGAHKELMILNGLYMHLYEMQLYYIRKKRNVPLEKEAPSVLGANS